MNRYVLTALCAIFTAGAQADRIRRDERAISTNPLVWRRVKQ